MTSVLLRQQTRPRSSITPSTTFSWFRSNEQYNHGKHFCISKPTPSPSRTNLDQGDQVESQTKIKGSELHSIETFEQIDLARRWIKQFGSEPISAFPKETLQISYSRSSGPGGQNVNKVSTKALIRFPFHSPRPPTFLPPYLIPTLKTQSPHYVNSQPIGLLISSSETRSQALNLDSAISKLKKTILDAAQVGLKGETSKQQKVKVQNLVKIEKSRMIKVKKGRKEVKSGRRSNGAGGLD